MTSAGEALREIGALIGRRLAACSAVSIAAASSSTPSPYSAASANRMSGGVPSVNRVRAS